MDKAKFWDGVADNYSKRPIANMDQHDRTVERSASYLTPRSQVLEVGCGTGTIAMRLAPYAGHVLATDFSARLLEIARERAAEKGVAGVTFELADAGAPPQGPFDAVLAYNVLHLIEDREAVLRDLAAQVKPGGVLITKTGCLGETFAGRLLRPVIGAMRLLGKAPFVAFLRARDIEAEIEKQGLEIIESETMGGAVVTRFVVARKPA